MSLTPKQRQHVIEAHEVLRDRGMVYLSGRQNGKTRTITRAQELVSATSGGRTSLRARTERDRDIEFVQASLYGRTDKITPYTFIRQIMLAMAYAPRSGYFQLSKQFEDLLWDYYQKGRVVALAIDNAELLPERAYYILKMLNEIRRNRTDIGVGVLVAGEYGKMRMPLPFLKRTLEIEVGRIDAVDVLGLIQTHWPGEASSFDEAAIKVIMHLSETTQEVKQNIDRVIRAKHRLDERKVSVDLVNAVFLKRAA